MYQQEPIKNLLVRSNKQTYLLTRRAAVVYERFLTAPEPIARSSIIEKDGYNQIPQRLTAAGLIVKVGDEKCQKYTKSTNVVVVAKNVTLWEADQIWGVAHYFKISDTYIILNSTAAHIIEYLIQYPGSYTYPELSSGIRAFLEDVRESKNHVKLVRLAGKQLCNAGFLMATKNMSSERSVISLKDTDSRVLIRNIKALTPRNKTVQIT